MDWPSGSGLGAPQPGTWASGEYAWARPCLEKEDRRYNPLDPLSDLASRGGQEESRRTLTRIDERTMPLELRGSGGKALIGYFARTGHIRAGRMELGAGAHLPAESHAGDGLVYVDQGSLFVFIPEASGQRWFEIGPRDEM
jgi:hypothetical protein